MILLGERAADVTGGAGVVGEAGRLGRGEAVLGVGAAILGLLAHGGRGRAAAGRRGEELAKVRGADTGGRVPAFGAVEAVPVVCGGRLRAKKTPH